MSRKYTKGNRSIIPRYRKCHRAKKLRKKCAKFRSKRATGNGAHVLRMPPKLSGKTGEVEHRFR